MDRKKIAKSRVSTTSKVIRIRLEKNGTQWNSSTSMTNIFLLHLAIYGAWNVPGAPQDSKREV
jgi:hypothetical protein